jgi:hypothetical protein
MNTRGIVQLVVLNIGVELGVISPMIFAIFVLMATILTFSTSPVLYLLFRRKADAQKLSVPNIAEDLRSAREEDEKTTEENTNNDTIETISNGGFNPKQPHRSSMKSTKSSSSSMPVHDTFVTFDDQINYSEINLNGNEQDLDGNIPYRCIKMTRF